MNPSPTLRRLPHWVGAARFTSNAYAWSDHDVPGDLLGWIEDSGPTADDRRRVARALLAAVRPAMVPPANARLRAVFERNAAAVERWTTGDGALPDFADLDATTARAARVAEVRFADADEERRTPNPRASHDEARALSRDVAAARLPLVAGLALGALDVVTYELRIAARGAGSDVSAAALLSAIRAEFPAPPNGYEAPPQPRRWPS